MVFKSASTVVDVTNTAYGMEYSVHDVPKRFKEELGCIFPGLDLTGLLIIPTCQNSAVDLVRVGEEIETEKDRLLERFMEWAKLVCEKLDTKGHWSDFMDPCSGLAMRTKECHVPYGEVDALSTLLGYQTANAGCCKVVLHPTWGSSIYPSTMFTKAPLADLVQAIQEVEKEIGNRV
eukprot:CAMPEP_0196580022 /NCGR_PEP_ID=MMETSP1081-20130531/26406_1 /TAXON_ID=36882 /ORGANISM="Pyramimonas amylifera, Strain CCMP720" /LENGTH=176 /DNA_ID=CAMNT_0041899773 /DNA_START=37 /DNA_END=567 /DNA_ORIENTATION=-